MFISLCRVTVRFNDSVVRVGYSTGWGRFFADTDDTEYTITLGPEEGGSESFLGGMANLVIDDRYGSKNFWLSLIHALVCFRGHKKES